MPPSDSVRLQHILDAEAITFAAGRRRDDLQRDRVILALVKRPVSHSPVARTAHCSRCLRLTVTGGDPQGHICTSALQEIIRLDSGLLQNRPERSLRHVAWMIRHCGYRFVPGLNQISWLPAAWRSNSKPHIFNFRTISLYRNPARPPIHAATTIV